MNRLAKERGLKGMTQGELGEKLGGITKAAVSFAEKNHISVNMAKNCAEILGVNMFSILGTDALKAIPQTEEDKEILINIIKEL